MNAQAHETLWLTPWTPAPAYEGEDGPIGTDMVKWQGWENAEPTTLRVDAGLDGDDTCRSELITMWAAAQQRARRTGTPGERLVRDQDGAQHIPAITDVNLQVKHKAGSAWRPLDEVMADIAQGTNVHAMELCLTIDGPGADGEVLRWELGEAYVGGSGDSIAEIAIVIAQDSARDVEAVSEILITGWGWVVEDYDSTSPEVQQYWKPVRCDHQCREGSGKRTGGKGPGNRLCGGMLDTSTARHRRRADPNRDRRRDDRGDTDGSRPQ